MHIPRKLLYLVALGAGVAALVGGLTILEGRDSISEEAGYPPIKQKQQNEIGLNPAFNIHHQNP
jgi:hypothetical protein